MFSIILKFGSDILVYDQESYKTLIRSCKILGLGHYSTLKRARIMFMASPIIPTLRYTDAKAAIVWLCDAFGFEQHAVYESDEGLILNAQLLFGDSMIMLSDQRDSEFDTLQKTPADTDNVCTQSCYVVVKDIEDHYQNACDAGAEIVIELTAEDSPGAGYSCRDLEGHLWNFGSYDPFAPAEPESNTEPSQLETETIKETEKKLDKETAELG